MGVAYIELGQPVDPAPQRRVLAGLFSVQPNPVNDTV